MTSAAGRQLTTQHRRAQLAVRDAVSRDVAAVWRAFDLSDIDRSWAATSPSMEALVRDYGSQSARRAADYYQAFRTAEDVPGPPTVRLASGPPTGGLRYSLGYYGRIVPKKLVAASRTDIAAQSLVHLSGGVSRHVLNQGRDTVIGSTADDRRARGFRRVTSVNPCKFCAGLAGRGAVYKTRSSAGSKVHDHCGCSMEPAY